METASSLVDRTENKPLEKGDDLDNSVFICRDEVNHLEENLMVKQVFEKDRVFDVPMTKTLVAIFVNIVRKDFVVKPLHDSLVVSSRCIQVNIINELNSWRDEKDLNNFVSTIKVY